MDYVSIFVTDNRSKDWHVCGLMDEKSSVIFESGQWIRIFFVTSRQFAFFLDRIFTRRWLQFLDGTRLQVVSVEIELAARVKWVISSEYRREGFHCRCHAAARHWPWHSRDIRAEIQWNIATKPSESSIVGDWSKYYAFSIVRVSIYAEIQCRFDTRPSGWILMCSRVSWMKPIVTVFRERFSSVIPWPAAAGETH